MKDLLDDKGTSNRTRRNRTLTHAIEEREEVEKLDTLAIIVLHVRIYFGFSGLVQQGSSVKEVRTEGEGVVSNYADRPGRGVIDVADVRKRPKTYS